MTYGWAILIIAIVIAAIFQRNLFNPYTFAPRASPGSCQIMRPNGPGSNLFVSAVGPACTINEIPQYVGHFKGMNAGSYVNLGKAETNLSGDVSVAAWVYPLNFSSYNYAFSNTRDCCGLYNGINLGVDGHSALFDMWNASEEAASGGNVNFNAWTFLVGTYNGSYLDIYLNGKLVGSNPGNVPAGIPASFNSYIGALALSPTVYNFNGSVSNVQVYNTSLSQPEITALYQEGIGGAPTNIQNLVGWWPLNGNAKDYSGNNNNGVPTNVIYTSSWTSGYSTP